MYFKIILFGTILLCINYSAGRSGNICYDAKICVHNRQEKCGVDGKGFIRRFLDSCDLLEYNCLYNTDFVKTPSTKCAGLPPIQDKEPVQPRNENKKLKQDAVYINNNKENNDIKNDEEEPKEIQNEHIDEEAADNQNEEAEKNKD